MQTPIHHHPKPGDPPLAPCGHMWVFAYGSLIWRPGFAHAGRHRALLRGYHRSFCLWSHRYRGTPERPGLVLGLDRGGACHGVAFRVPGSNAAEVLRYLDDRELPDGAEQVYHRRLVPVRLLDAPDPRGVQVVPAVTYVANRACRLYAPRLAPEAAAAAIAQGVGQMGANRDYLLNTLSHLAEMGVRDAGLARIAALLPRAAGAA
ncbi:gamma-glutamylcyclotransferase [Planktothrix agardhii 1811]|uniref:gamma-glutamylcyclotransferase n=1 Tax=Planktothrix agardhii TaxID=1160 RepID=UPI001F1B6D6F|nr:gamma-glutamylcyclotransferase [Planktothrix agardhii]MCF3580047.1 gamma-glutamylcyclotransferase [Planktothrix agardhii 1811]